MRCRTPAGARCNLPYNLEDYYVRQTSSKTFILTTHNSESFHKVVRVSFNTSRKTKWYVMLMEMAIIDEELTKIDSQVYALIRRRTGLFSPGGQIVL